MEYYIVRIYRREPGRVAAGERRDVQLTGLVEDDSGRKAVFHNAEALWRLLAREIPAAQPGKPESDG